MDIFDITPVKTFFPKRIATTICISEPQTTYSLRDWICSFAENASEEESVLLEKMIEFMGKGLSLKERLIVGGGYTPVLAIRWKYRLPQDLTAQQFNELIDAYTGDVAYETTPLLVPPPLVQPLVLPFQMTQAARHGEKTFLCSIDREHRTGEYIFPALKDEHPVFIFIGAGPLPKINARA